MFYSYYFIVNPVAGMGKKLSFVSEITSFCQRNYLNYKLVMTHRPKEAIELAREASKKYEVIVAVGGDGTVNEVVNGIADTDAKLGIIPIGSGNDFAKQMGLTYNLSKDLRILMDGKLKTVDLGKVNDRHYFINGVGVGFDGEVAYHVRDFLKYAKGFSGYLLSVFRTLATYKFHKVKFFIDGEKVKEEKILLIATCNGTTYGGGFKVAPSAKVDDGLFTVCFVSKMGKFYAMRNIPKILQGTHVSLPEVSMYTGKSVKIKSEKELFSQLDGEILPPMKEFSMEMVPSKIKVIRK
ncbi:MAG: diacylglycerol/lipid kinase family protein [Candidatus Kerfeldbacteria bacterium]